MSGKRVLCTGAAGFLGREVRRQLEAKGMDVFAVDNYEPGCGASPEAGRVEILDITDRDACSWLRRQDFSHIIHLAAIGRNLTCAADFRRAFEVNVSGTLNMLELARHQEAQLLFCSSNIVLSDKTTVYRFTKRTAEDLVRLYADHGTNAMILRPSNIAGSGQSRTEFQPCAFAMMDKCFEENGYIEITGDGRQRRDFVNVKDVARAFILALDKMIPGATFDICTGQSVSMLDVMKAIGVQFRFVAARPGDAQELVSDHRPAANSLNFVSEIPFSDTVMESFPAVLSAKTSHSR